MRLCCTIVAISAGFVEATAASGQASVVGRVLADSARRPLAGAEVRAVRAGISAITDSAGRFTLRNLPPGQVGIITRALGFRPDTSLLDLFPDETVSREIVLRRSLTTLREVRVSDSAVRVHGKLTAYEARKQRAPGGKFLDRALIEKWEDRLTGDLFSTLAGVDVVRSGSAAYAAGSRAAPSLLVRTRPQRACFMDVYLDGAMVYSAANPNSPPFDVNSIRLSHVAAIEVYTSAANMPPEFNRTSKGCGVLVIWTR